MGGGGRRGGPCIEHPKQHLLTHTICTFPSLSVSEGSVALSGGGEKATGRLEFLDHPRQGLKQPLFLLVTSRRSRACYLHRLCTQVPPAFPPAVPPGLADSRFPPLPTTHPLL